MSATTSRVSSFETVSQIEAGLLDVGYVDAGPADGPAVVLLHGWPYDIHSYVDVVPLLAAQGYRVDRPVPARLRDDALPLGRDVPQRRAGGARARHDRPDGRPRDRDARSSPASTGEPGRPTSSRRSGRSAATALVSVSGYLIGSQAAGKLPLPPEAELQWWYQYYFATERGRAGYEKYRREFAKLIWRTASPKWNFDDATFERSAASFDNPDHVAIVIHNYRWRLGLADGEAEIRRPRAAARRRPGHRRARRSRSRATRTARRIRPRPPTPRSSRARTRTGRSRAASGTTCPRRRRRRSPRPSSTSTPTDDGEPRRRRDSGSTCPSRATCPARRRDRLAQLAAADRGRPAGEGRAGRLLDLHLHQLAAHARLRPRLGREVRDQGLVVVGVHTPEFPFERDIDNVRRAAKDMRVDYPIALDSDYASLGRVRQPLLAGRLHRRRGRPDPAPPLRRGRLRRVREGHPGVAARGRSARASATTSSPSPTTGSRLRPTGRTSSRPRPTSATSRPGTSPHPAAPSSTSLAPTRRRIG